MSIEGENGFEYFKDLLSLDLSSNGIKSLPDSVFKSQNNLRILNLSKNSLLLINFQVAHLTKITTIDVSENLLSQLGEKLQKDLETLKHGSPNFTMNMLGNPIQCSCETLSFLQWMDNTKAMFVSYYYYEHFSAQVNTGTANALKI